MPEVGGWNLKKFVALLHYVFGGTKYFCFASYPGLVFSPPMWPGYEADFCYTV